LASNTRGVALGFSGQGMKLEVTDPPVNSAVQYEVGFGFNKIHVSDAAKEVLNQLVAAWKCRPVNIWLFGFTDTVGHEDENLPLSANRAEGVRQYLINEGIPGNRVFIQAMGEKDARIPTPDQTRLRANRAVVALVQDM
jgi:OmpA-OmpF porin, OOP family